MTDENNIKTTAEELKKLLDSQNLIGKYIETEDKLLIPIMKMGFSVGAGEKFGQEAGGNASGAIAGVEPVSMVVITKGVEGIEGIRVLDLSKGTSINKAITDLGLVISDVIKDLTNKDKTKVVDIKDANTDEKNLNEEKKESVKVNLDNQN